jgi:hypothetical protein
MKIVRFRKIYNSPQMGEEGNAIIIYRKIEWDTVVKWIADNPCYITTKTTIRYVRQYKKLLIIDLWIVRFHFEWLTKLKEIE